MKITLIPPALSNCYVMISVAASVGVFSKFNTEILKFTIRDGSAVELVGLCKSAVRWLGDLTEAKIFPYEGVSKNGEDGK